MKQYTPVWVNWKSVVIPGCNKIGWSGAEKYHRRMAVRMVYALGEQLQKILGGLLSNDHECFEQICFYFSLSVCLHTVTIQAKNDRLRGPPHHRPVCAMVHIHTSQMCHHASSVITRYTVNF